MKQIGLLKNRIQEYNWGSYTAMAQLMGKPVPSETPQAELWMGAHPKAPSLVNIDGAWAPLDMVIEAHPEDILGKTAAKAFGGKLPYLFKVLAAAKPLSIQAHPDRDRAKAGFKRENEQGIPLDAANRNYQDDMHKPEIICALTPFWALNGFRKIDDMVSNFHRFCPKATAAAIDGLNHHPGPDGLKRFFEFMMTVDSEQKQLAIEETVQSAQSGPKEDTIGKCIVSLHKEYPSDIGILAPLYLNLLCLEPGEAMFLPAGQLHAYLDGLGMELMANSDNVLRGGLTPKHVDVPELLKSLSFHQTDIEILSPEPREAGCGVYAGCAEEFVLSVIDVKGGRGYAGPVQRSVEIVFCAKGEAVIHDRGADETIAIKAGQSAIIPAAVETYAIDGDAVLYKASVLI